MAPRSNLSATRRTVRALREAEQITDRHAGLVQLAESLARTLDEVLASDDKRYVVAQLARAHQAALGAFLGIAEPVVAEPIEQLLAHLGGPGGGSFDGVVTPRL
jgi:hypothetical protein